MKTLLLVATFTLGRLEGSLSPHADLWLLAASVVMRAAPATRGPGQSADVLARFGRERRART